MKIRNKLTTELKNGRNKKLEQTANHAAQKKL